MIVSVIFFLWTRQDELLDEAFAVYEHVEGEGAGIGSKYTGTTMSTGEVNPAGQPYTRMLVMGRLKSDDISWVNKEMMNVNTTIYVVDDADSEVKMPKNKGREAMVYLTYIIDNYDNLADTNMFFHSHSSAWHNNILLELDSAKTIRRMSDAHIARQGYMNARCHLDPGCPHWLEVDRPTEEWDLVKKNEERFLTRKVWTELYGEQTPLPKALSQPCCAQFAVSKDRIRRTEKARYEHFREWLLNTDLSDEISGRILEYSWQYLFTGETEFCPSMHKCYCDGFGICFGGEKQLDYWLQLLKKRENLDDVVDGLEKKGEKDLKKKAEKLKPEMDRELDRLKNEAYERGERPEERAKECGRAWKEGDSF